MATFVWDPAVQWPPPAHILLGYDVVAPDGVLLSSRRDRRGDIEEESMTQPYLALITPLTGHPDQGLPGGGNYPDQGLPGQPPRPAHPIAPGGSGGSPSHPIYHPGHPDHGLPAYPDQGLPGGGGQPPGYWGGANPHPDQGLPGGQGGRPDQGLPPFPDQGLPPANLPPGGTEVPEDVYEPAPIPEEIASQYVVSVYNPKTMQWTTKSYPPR